MKLLITGPNKEYPADKYPLWIPEMNYLIGRIVKDPKIKMVKKTPIKISTAVANVSTVTVTIHTNQLSAVTRNRLIETLKVRINTYSYSSLVTQILNSIGLHLYTNTQQLWLRLTEKNKQDLRIHAAAWGFMCNPKEYMLFYPADRQGHDKYHSLRENQQVLYNKLIHRLQTIQKIEWPEETIQLADAFLEALINKQDFTVEIFS